MVGLPYGEKKLWQYFKSFLSNPWTSRTDRQICYQYRVSVSWRAIKIGRYLRKLCSNEKGSSFFDIVHCTLTLYWWVFAARPLPLCGVRVSVCLTCSYILSKRVIISSFFSTDGKPSHCSFSIPNKATGNLEFPVICLHKIPGGNSREFMHIASCIYTVSKKKGATDFFAVTFTNIDGFS